MYRVAPGHLLVQTIDFFTPVVDDPRLFGQIAAANALSDIYAMRARPVLALAFVAFPTSVLPAEVLEAILRGGSEKVAEAGAVIGGGHSIDHDVPLYGLSVTGIVEESRVTRNSGARPGDALVLTKPLGIGLTVCAGRADTLAAEGISGIFRKRLLSDDELSQAVSVMTSLNRTPVDAMEGFDVHAVTDVTGYGLLGHLHEMMAASATAGEVWVDRIPLLPAARRLAARGIAPDGSRVNVRNLKPRLERGADVSDEDLLLLCDAQTSGGLLVALPQPQAEKYAARCRELGATSAAVVGRVIAREDNARLALRVAKDRKEAM